MSDISDFARATVDPDLLNAIITLILAHDEQSPLDTTTFPDLVALCSEHLVCPPEMTIAPIARALAFFNVIQPGRPAYNAEMPADRIDWHATVAAATATVTVDAAMTAFDFDDTSFAAHLAEARLSPPATHGMPFTLDDLSNGTASALPAIPSTLLSAGVRLARLIPNEPVSPGTPFNSLIEAISRVFALRPIVTLSIAARIAALNSAHQDPHMKALPRDPAGASATGAAIMAAAHTPVAIHRTITENNVLFEFRFDMPALLAAIPRITTTRPSDPDDRASDRTATVLPLQSRLIGATSNADR